MNKIASRFAASPTDRAELREVAHALQKMRSQFTIANAGEKLTFQLTAGSKAVRAEQFGDTEVVKIAVSPEVLDSITRLIFEAAEITVKSHTTSEELTTQQAANLLGVSRPYFIKLLDANKIPYRRVGHYRRIRRADLERYEQREQERREAGLSELAAYTQEIGLEY